MKRKSKKKKEVKKLYAHELVLIPGIEVVRIELPFDFVMKYRLLLNGWLGDTIVITPNKRPNPTQ